MRLRAWDLAIERGGRRLFASLSFEADQGSALIVTGPNGAGKSSLLRALCGFLPLQAGGFALEGGDSERTVGEQAHYLGHADALKGALTAGENLAFWAGALGGDSSRESELARRCASLGLSHVIDFPAARAVSRTEAPRRARPPPRRPPAALAARRADDRARRRGAGGLRHDHAGPSRATAASSSRRPTPRSGSPARGR